MRRERRRNVASASRQQLRLAGVVTVADNDHAGPRMHHAGARVAVEIPQAFADARAPGPSRGEQVQALLRSPRIRVAQRFRRRR